MSETKPAALRPVRFGEWSERRVLFAVELVDAFTGELVRDGVRVSVRGLANKPLANLSGRFVFLEEPAAVPGKVRVELLGPPFEPPDEVDPPKPPSPTDPPEVAAAKRLLSITLRPTAAYPFPPDTTVLRGWITENGRRLPRVLAEALFEDGEAGHRAASARTDARGDFALPLLLAKRDRKRGDPVGFALRFTREADGGQQRRARRFLRIAEGASAAADADTAGRINSFDWSKLQPV